MKPLLLLILLVSGLGAAAQGSYKPVRGYWDRAGYAGVRPAFTETRNVLDFGADPSGSRSANDAFEDALSDLKGRPGTILFPAGTYFFDTPILLDRDSLVIRGAGHDSSRLRFDLGGQARNLISITGSSSADSSRLGGAFLRGDSVITVTNPERFREGDWIRLSVDDAAFMKSDWAFGTLGQTVQIRRIRGNVLELGSRARFNYTLLMRPRVHRVMPRTGVGVECLAIERMDATAGQSSNIAFDMAVNCWISGIESDKTNFAHVELNRASNIEIRNSWFHDAFAYGGGGQAYGVLLQTGTNECLVTGNYFRHLRHSMLLQSGANGNVLSYNYSTKPYWTETALPDSSAGEIVLHGNFPFMNLAEGNMVQNIVIDDSHGRNGPLNTFFRNRAAGYGIFMNFSPPTDSVQFIGNEVTNPANGLYFISGSGHLQYANNYNGTIMGTPGAIPDKSLYLAGAMRPECSDGLAWPAIGEPGQAGTGSIPAKLRAEAGTEASCGCVTRIEPTGLSGKTSTDSWQLVPNPASDMIRITGPETPGQVDIYDMSGRIVLQLHEVREGRILLPALPPGPYSVRISTRATTRVLPLVILR